VLRYIVCEDRKTLPYLADLATIDLHPSHHTIQTLAERFATRGDLFRSVLSRPKDQAPAVALLEDDLRTR
jgi:uncharacterized membrane protein YqiK